MGHLGNRPKTWSKRIAAREPEEKHMARPKYKGKSGINRQGSELGSSTKGRGGQ